MVKKQLNKIKVGSLFFDSCKSAIYRALIHEIKDQYEADNITYMQRSSLISLTNIWNTHFSSEFPKELLSNLRIFNGTQRILPLLELFEMMEVE